MDLYLIVFYNIQVLGKMIMMLGLLKTYHKNEKKSTEVIEDLTNKIKILENSKMVD